MKNIIITGANSYVGMAVESWLLRNPLEYNIKTIDMLDSKWTEFDFSKYEVVFHVAGIAHADISKVSEETKKMYYKVNTELAEKVAEKAKNSGVKQFIFMSSMIVYSGCKEFFITKDTVPKPLNFYGDSKLQAEEKIKHFECEDFKVVILRPPMIYGKNSKGNYPKLSKIASRLSFFPKVNNKRSMLYIGNLCQFIKLIVDNEESGTYFPQNREYSNTSELVKYIAETKGRKIHIIFGFDWLCKLLTILPFKIGQLARKAFGNFLYDKTMSEYKENYQIFSLEDSIKLTEKE